MAQAQPKDATETRAAAEAVEQFHRLRAEIAERTRDLTEEEQRTLGEQWAEAVRGRLAARVRQLRNEADR